MSNHEHDWQIIPERSGGSVSRYRCACGVYGYRAWTGGFSKVPPIRPYTSGALPPVETEPETFADHGRRARMKHKDLQREARRREGEG